MGSTIAEKIIARAAGRESVRVGDLETVHVDLAMANEFTAPLALKQFSKAGASKVFDPDKICIVAGRHAPFKDTGIAAEVGNLAAFCKAQGIRHFYGHGEGMDHALVPELGLIHPGMLICNGDSHACTVGALGAFAIAMGSTDMAYIFAFGETWLKVPATIIVQYKGKPGRFITSKDFILATLGRLGVDGARYKSLEFSGEALRGLSMDERFTITNMAIEMGGKAGMIETDAVMEAYLAARTAVPFVPVKSDPDAEVEAVIDIDAGNIPPLVAKPHLPSNVVPVGEIRGVKVTQVSIGTCTNGRMIDLEQAASLLRGNRVAKGVRLIVTPATGIVYRQAMKAGLLEVFADAGAIINPPGCGPCAGWHMGVLTATDVCMTTHNRNFRGRMGDKDAQIYLGSPYVAAATAIAGVIVDPQEVTS
jgi:3-isopropylmalate/(R)-2-methylmalate dehydratase large subunit